MERQERIISDKIKLVKEDGHFFINMEEEVMEIPKEEALQILANNDYVYDVIIKEKRRYWFNTAMDRFSPNEY